jgi:hypothetical protein
VMSDDDLKFSILWKAKWKRISIQKLKTISWSHYNISPRLPFQNKMWYFMTWRCYFCVTYIYLCVILFGIAFMALYFSFCFSWCLYFPST